MLKDFLNVGRSAARKPVRFLSYKSVNSYAIALFVRLLSGLIYCCRQQEYGPSAAREDGQIIQQGSLACVH